VKTDFVGRSKIVLAYRRVPGECQQLLAVSQEMAWFLLKLVEVKSQGASTRKANAMFRKILVPVDLTDSHLPALRIAAQLAEQNGGSVTVLHVVQTIYGLALSEERDFYARLERKARAQMEKFQQQVEKAKVAWHLEVLYGTPAAEIVRFAIEKHMELIVLTSHRINRENFSEGWGTLSHKIGILAPCPVLLVK
jgi:universal stress protein A